MTALVAQAVVADKAANAHPASDTLGAHQTLTGPVGQEEWLQTQGPGMLSPGLGGH